MRCFKYGVRTSRLCAARYLNKIKKNLLVANTFIRWLSDEEDKYLQESESEIVQFVSFYNNDLHELQNYYKDSELLYLRYKIKEFRKDLNS